MGKVKKVSKGTVLKRIITEKEQALIAKMRSEGASIKKIARELHISDKKIAEKVKFLDAQAAGEENFQKFVAKVCNLSYRVSCDFTTSLYEGVCDLIQDVLDADEKCSKATVGKKAKKVLEDHLDKFMDAAFMMGMVALWTMPAKYKTMWLDNLGIDPKMKLSKEAKGRGQK